MAVPNSGYTFNVSIPTTGNDTGVIVIELSEFVSTNADIFHVNVSGGGMLKGIRLLDSGSPIEPSDATWYSTFTIAAAAGSTFTVKHLSVDVSAGERVYCPGFLADTIVDEHDHFCRYAYDVGTSEWITKANTWIAA